MGAIVNGVAIFIAGFLGSRIRNVFSEALSQRLMQGISLVIIMIGISGALNSQNILIMILSIVIGTIIGEWLDLDAMIKKLVNQSVGRFIKEGQDSSAIAHAFISATMIFCVGAMLIVGSIESGLNGDNSTLYIKSLLDGITSVLLASSLGWGVMLSGVPVLLAEGALTLLARFFAPYLTAAVTTEIVSVGSVLLLGLGLNMLGVTNLKIMNFVPAVVIPILFIAFI